MSHASVAASNIPGFTGFYVFGDSLVDPGNALKAAEFLGDLPFVSVPSGAPTADKGYFQGRFSDGYNFADLVSNKLLANVTATTFPYGFKDPVLGLPIPFASKPDGNNLSFAYGGAQVIGGYVPDLDGQTDIYRNFTPDPNALYLITLGGNDVRALVPDDGDPVVGDAASAQLATIAAEVAQEVGQLYQRGVRNVLVTGIPDVGLIPEYAGSSDEAMRRSLATEYSERLDALVKTALGSLTLPAEAKLYSYSFLDQLAAVFADPAGHAFTNLTEARKDVQAGHLDAVGSGFLFFDDVHPSYQAHAQIAAQILSDLAGGPSDAPVPLQAGPRILGGIEAAGGLDGFTAALVAGQTYVFDLLSVSSGSGSLGDPKLRLLDSGGGVVAEDDDGGLGLDAHLVFTAPATGSYTLQASAVGVLSGSYVLQGPDLRGSDVTILGGALNDTIGAVSGSNLLRGGDGNDSIVGGAGFDTINGNMGDDICLGGAGADRVSGGKGDDALYGQLGDDTVFGNLGNDLCNGGAGADIIRGGQQDDTLRGGLGNDWLSGDRGDDTVTGGAGADVFHTFAGAGLDRVTDFRLADGDRVQLDAGTQYSVAQVGDDTVISMTGGGQMVLVGVSQASLTGDWIFEA